jgi:hypothetical protein
MLRPDLVYINKSDDNLYDGQSVRVTDMVSENGEVDYRVVTNGGEEFWIPAENTSIIH